MGDVRVHRKTKRLICGHDQEFVSPIPQQGDWVWCGRCDSSSRLPPRPRSRVVDGRRRRLVENPKSNNQWTRGRTIDTASHRKHGKVN